MLAGEVPGGSGMLGVFVRCAELTNGKPAYEREGDAATMEAGKVRMLWWARGARWRSTPDVLRGKPTCG